MGNWYQRTYPPEGRILCDGGLATKYSPAIIPDDFSPDCANVMFENGAVGTRGGMTALCSSIGSHAVQGLYVRHANDGTETLCMWASTNMYILSGTSFAPVTQASGFFTSGSRIAAAEYENYIFFGQSGVTAPLKYNGSLSYHGVYPPISGPTVATSTSGTNTLSGTIYYKTTWVNSGIVEGNVSSASTGITVSSGQAIGVTVPVASSIYGVARRKIYRTLVGSGVSGTYYHVATLNDNTTTFYNDITPDASLATSAPVDQGLPPQYSVAKVHQNRVFTNDVSNGNFLYYSELANPYVFATTNFLRIGDNASDLIRGIEIFDNGLVCFCQRGTYIVYMPSADDSSWIVVKARATLGSSSPFGAIGFNNKIMFPATSAGKFVGFATLAGDVVEPSATFLTVSVAGSELQSDVIEPDMFDVAGAYIGNISAIDYKNRLYFAVPYGNTTTNNRIYVYDYSISNLSKRKQGAWVPYTGINPSQFVVFNGLLYCGDSTSTGQVHQLETTSYNDNAVAIDSYWKSKDYSGLKAEEDLFKDFRTLQVVVDKAGQYQMNLYTVIDGEDSDGDLTTLDLSNTGSTWNNFVWGTGIWGSGRFREDKRVFLGQKRGKAISFKFSNQNTANQRFKVHGFRFTYNIKGRR